MSIETRFVPWPTAHVFLRMQRAEDNQRVEWTPDGSVRTFFDQRRLQREALLEVWASGVDVWGRVQISRDLFDQSRAVGMEGGARLTGDLHVLTRVVMVEESDGAVRSTHFLAFQSRPWDDLWIELEMGRSEPAAFGLLAGDRGLPLDGDLPGSARLIVRGWIHQ